MRAMMASLDIVGIVKLLGCVVGWADVGYARGIQIYVFFYTVQRVLSVALMM
jgi:hypothetical protein